MIHFNFSLGQVSWPIAALAIAGCVESDKRLGSTGGTGVAGSAGATYQGPNSDGISPKAGRSGTGGAGDFADTGNNEAICFEFEARSYEGSLVLRKTSLRQSCTYLRNFMP